MQNSTKKKITTSHSYHYISTWFLNISFFLVFCRTNLRIKGTNNKDKGSEIESATPSSTTQDPTVVYKNGKVNDSYNTNGELKPHEKENISNEKGQVNNGVVFIEEEGEDVIKNKNLKQNWNVEMN